MLQSYRIGFATNSSSTHSVILHSKWAKDRMPEDQPYWVDTSYSSSLVEQDHRLSTPANKLEYILFANFLYAEMRDRADQSSRAR